MNPRIFQLSIALWVGLTLGILVSLWGGPWGQGGVDWAAVFEREAPSVLLVNTGPEQGRRGAAVAISPREAITARHLVLDSLEVGLMDVYGEVHRASVVGTDARTDLALLKVEAAVLQPARLGDVLALRVGDPITTIGNPFGLGHSLSAGVVSHPLRKLTGSGEEPSVALVQLSVPVSPGNSGGPVLDTSGAVVGILAGIHTQGQGIAFAVPVVESDLSMLRSGAHISRAFLGVQLEADGDAAVVTGVIASSPADRSGIRRGDRMTSVAGRRLEEPSDLEPVLDERSGGEEVEVELIRDGTPLTLRVELGDWALQPVVVSGMTLVPDPGTGGEVVAVRERSRASSAGARVGDRVLSVNGQPVMAPSDVRDALGPSGEGSLEVVRAGTALSLVLH